MTLLINELRELIRLREYRVGERIPSERELAVHFGASRPKVRRAITTLEEHGVLETRDRSGIYMRGTDASELLAARLVIEPWAAAEAARLATSEDHLCFSELLQHATDSVSDEVAFTACDRRLHDHIMSAARNTLMTELYSSLKQRIDASRDQTAPCLETRKQALTDLTKLIVAIQQADPDRAAASMIHHLQSVPMRHPLS